jgi:hypothetical protein
VASVPAAAKVNHVSLRAGAVELIVSQGSWVA